MGSDLITVHITMHKLCKVKENYIMYVKIWTNFFTFYHDTYCFKKLLFRNTNNAVENI